MAELPITERSNTLSTTLDISSPKDIVEIIGQCEKQIYTGWENHEGLSSPKFLKLMEAIAGKTCAMLKNPKGKGVVISGCGTSGRLAFMAVRSANDALERLGNEPICDYVISGYDRALFLSIESAEDSPETGIQMLKEVTQDKDEVLFIGITCGFSAPFVAGQLDYCLNHPNFTPVLVGFNPCELARNNSVEHWDKTFKQVVEHVQKEALLGNAFILNPVIGPEPITGSSRMKGGSATKIMLDTIFDMALDLYNGRELNASDKMKEYEASHQEVYKASEDIGHVLEIAGQSLCAGGHIFYVGIDGLGILGIIDASECPPTFGADPSDVQGFLRGGYASLRNKEGDLSPEINISAEQFLQGKYPTLSAKDTVIFLSLDGQLPDVPEIMVPAQTVLVLLVSQPEISPTDYYNRTVKLILPNIQEPLPDCNIRQRHLAEIMCKWVCNAITTGAHIMKGKVYQNSMIDVSVRNNKLYSRAINLIKKYVKVTNEEAETLLQRSIYMTDSLTDVQRNSSISSHITVAASLKKVVPRAMVLGLMNCDVQTTENILAKSPRIRTTLMESLKKQTC